MSGVCVSIVSMSDDDDHLWSSLTNEIGDKSSPLRGYFDATFPMLRPVQAEYRASAGPILVDAGGANPGTLGAAFDFLVRLVLDPEHVPDVALLAFARSPQALRALRDVVVSAQNGAASARHADASEGLLRACWVLALTTEVYRLGGIVPGSPLARLRGGGFTADELLAVVPDSGVTETQALHTLAREHLYPQVPSNALLALGPTFAASHLCPADADLVYDGCLVDIKTHLGAKSKIGRSDGLSLADIYQLLGYALFDRADEFAISRVGIYSARYAHLMTWDLRTFLDTLAGRPVDLMVERRRVWAMLGGPS